MEVSQFEIIINVLFSSFRFIWIPMLWVYGHYKYFNSFSAGTVFIRQNLTSTDVRFWCIKTVPALKGLKHTQPQKAHLGDIFCMLFADKVHAITHHNRIEVSSAIIRMYPCHEYVRSHLCLPRDLGLHVGDTCMTHIAIKYCVTFAFSNLVRLMNVPIYSRPFLNICVPGIYDGI